MKKSEYYSRLVESVATYYSLMELSQDLISRVQLYEEKIFQDGGQKFENEKQGEILQNFN